MKQLKIDEVVHFLNNHDDFCILTHRRPDGDTIGCSAALCRGLRQIGKTAVILENPEITDKYRQYHQGLTVPRREQGTTVISVDVASEKMLSDSFAELLPDIQLLIDHHGSNSGFAAEGWVDPDSAACGEMIYELLMKLGVWMTREIGEAIYVAVSTDTGCFRFSNTTAHTLTTAAACLNAGADTYSINKVLFETTSLSRLKMDAYLAQNLELFADGTIALVRIPKEIEQSCGVSDDDMDSVSNFARNVEGVRLAVTFRTDRSGETKLSVRSAPGYDASAVCAELGGGGHAGAAGARISSTQEEAREQILKILKKQGYLQ